MPRSTFSPSTSKSGQITSGLGYSIDTTSANISVSVNPLAAPLLERRIFLSFKTDTLPATAEVVRVTLGINLVSSTAPVGQPIDWYTEIYAGTFIGASLDASDWNGGSFNAYVQNGIFSSGTYDLTDFDPDICAQINKTGDTDFRISDASNYDPTKGQYIATYRKSSFSLGVWYYLPGEQSGDLESMTFRPRAVMA